MTDITKRLLRIYVSEGANYVQEAADLIDKLRAERDMWKDTVSQRDRQIAGLVNDVHSCGPTCTRAGCVNGRLRDALQFVERWANHHGAKPHTTPQEALSVIQHYPPIVAITKGYKDGKVPDTPDPWEQVRVLRDALESIKHDSEFFSVSHLRSLAKIALEQTK